MKYYWLYNNINWVKSCFWEVLRLIFCDCSPWQFFVAEMVMLQCFSQFFFPSKKNFLQQACYRSVSKVSSFKVSVGLCRVRSPLKIDDYFWIFWWLEMIGWLRKNVLRTISRTKVWPVRFLCARPPHIFFIYFCDC